MFNFFLCSLGLKINNRHRSADRLTRSCGENKQVEVPALFQEKSEKIVHHDNDNEVKITNVIKSATSDITNAELTPVAKEMQKSCNQKLKHQKAAPEILKKEVGMYAKVHGTASAIKKIFVQTCQYNFNRTTVKS